ncbi:Sodium Channel Protein Type 8 Subunit Alpha [Manis pentadactyla]|nr:Sodium Channel Protein Type 8 Subunit Alpha [Manis pentadactyla]
MLDEKQLKHTGRYTGHHEGPDALAVKEKKKKYNLQFKSVGREELKQTQTMLYVPKPKGITFHNRRHQVKTWRLILD